MQLITTEGAAFRTRILTREQAERFASCLRANAQYTNVLISENSRSKSARRFFVKYQPAAEQRQEALLAGHEAKSQAKADAEGRDYYFEINRESPQPFARCYSVSGKEYEVTLFDCTCPHFKERLRGTGVRCKHMIRFEQIIEDEAAEVAEEVRQANEDAAALEADRREQEERWARAEATINRDFPLDALDEEFARA